MNRTGFVCVGLPHEADDLGSVNRSFIVRPFAAPDSKPKRYSEVGGRHTDADDR